MRSSPGASANSGAMLERGSRLPGFRYPGAVAPADRIAGLGRPACLGLRRGPGQERLRLAAGYQRQAPDGGLASGAGGARVEEIGPGDNQAVVVCGHAGELERVERVASGGGPRRREEPAHLGRGLLSQVVPEHPHQAGPPERGKRLRLEQIDERDDGLGVDRVWILPGRRGEIGECRTELAHGVLRLAAHDLHLRILGARQIGQPVELEERRERLVRFQQRLRTGEGVGVRAPRDVLAGRRPQRALAREREGGLGEHAQSDGPRRIRKSPEPRQRPPAVRGGGIGATQGAPEPDASAAAQGNLAHHLRRRLALVHREVHGVGEHHFTRLGAGLGFQGQLHGLAVQVAAGAPHLALAERDPHLDPLAGLRLRVPGRETVLHGHGAEHGVGGRDEGREQRVAQALHFAPPVSTHDGQEQRIVERQHARVLVAGLPAGPGRELLHVREQEDEVLLGPFHGSAPSLASAKKAVATAIMAASPAPTKTRTLSGNLGNTSSAWRAAAWAAARRWREISPCTWAPSGEGKGPNSGNGESAPSRRNTRIGSGTPLSWRSPESSARTSARFIESQTDSPNSTSPGPAWASIREAMLTGSPNTSPRSIRTSPRWIPTRACSLRSGGTPSSNRRTRSRRAAAQSTAWVGESNATRKVPPVCLILRPPNRRKAGSTRASWIRSIRCDSSQVSAPSRSA